MSKKMFMISCCFVMLVVVVSVSGKIKMGQQIRPSEHQKDLVTPSEPIPEPVVYSAFFHHVVNVKEQADETENSGESAASLRTYYQNQAGLNDDQVRALNNIAEKCVADVARQDALAQEVIRKFQSQFANGRIPKGVKLPPPPTSLAALQEEKNVIILRARGTLQSTLGEFAFNKVRNYITANIAPNIKPISLQGK